MKLIRITFTTFILITLFMYGYAQEYPIPAPDSRWGGLTMYGPPGLPGSGYYGSVEKYSVKDTVINGISFQYWGGEYSRYVDNKLLILDKLNSTSDSLVEEVYYDFNLEVNDSFRISRYLNSYAVVTEKTVFKSLNGQSRKRILLNGKGFYLDWIEGIGDVWNGVFYHNQIGLYDIHWWVVCYSDSSGTVFKDERINFPCDSLDGYVELFDTTHVDNNSVLQDNSKIIFPNPFTDQITIDTSKLPQFTSVSILNSTGEVLVKTTNRVINTSVLKSGLYILKIEYERECYFRKMIKR
jgi:hypothetical protein